ncbi:MAG: hypothetical protein KIT84_14070 [Labilithrix sp.]|nr:hypothetical protein [Labilithrix sp.]MCW5812147.1 hypothetical protein [Labilithrix sp.]
MLVAVVAAGCAAEAEPVGRDESAMSLTDTAVMGSLQDRIKPLKTVRVPAPKGSAIVDQAAAVRLGKALFWDVQAGGDGQTACASCHYAAGADTRTKNTLAPGPDGRFASLGVTAPDQELTPGNIDNDDRVGSQGVTSMRFVGLSEDLASGADRCEPAPSPVFGEARQVTPRNSSTVIGSVFMRELFWDGRARGVFNGVDLTGEDGIARVEASALASQATGPANDPIEMSCAGRGFNGPGGLGAKLLARRALQHQHVDPTDGVLGGSALRCGDHACTYRELVAAAFGDLDAEAKFSLVWGEAIQAYEATLVPDDTPLDRYLSGDFAALTDRQKYGFWVFLAPGNCVTCHFGAELSDASWAFAEQNGLVNQDGGDVGYHNVGVRPVSGPSPEDLGRASFSRTAAPADRGAFKTPSLRNVGLTAPYFHNGGKATLADVVTFYGNWSEHADDVSISVRQISSLVASLPNYKDALVDFLQNGLTDCRVAQERAPFDHPSLDVPNGPRLAAVGAEGHGVCP